MTTIEQLEALDLLLWSRSGEEAAALAFCNQSSVSRRVASVLNAFGLKLKRGHELRLLGDLILLSDWCNEPAIAALLDDLRRRQIKLQRRLPQLVGRL